MDPRKSLDKNQQTIQRIQQHIGGELARTALSIGAIRLNTEQPFQWASGYRMPIYNDNRQLLQDPAVRQLVAQGFAELLDALEWDPGWVAGTATAGIPHATTLADRLRLPLTYVRSSNKGHGMGNRIEGLAPEGSYDGQRVILIEDLISTGGSSINAVKAVRQADGIVPYCLAIFTYGLKAAGENFADLDPACIPLTILTYDMMIEAAVSTGYIDREQAQSLSSWREDPFGWGESRGFPRETGGEA
jgi:orotate phosphoribosyltransferase